MPEGTPAVISNIQTNEPAVASIVAAHKIAIVGLDTSKFGGLEQMTAEYVKLFTRAYRGIQEATQRR
jgi:hypothetical protein